jgi:hypothetical protein
MDEEANKFVKLISSEGMEVSHETDYVYGRNIDRLRVWFLLLPQSTNTMYYWL